VAYAMFKLEDRRSMMIEPGLEMSTSGMIFVEHTRENYLRSILLKGTQLTNIRTPRRKKRFASPRRSG